MFFQTADCGVSLAEGEGVLEAACADGGAWHLLVSSSCLDHMALRVTPFLSPPAPGRTPCCLCSVLGPLRRPVLADVPCAGTTRPGVGRDPAPALLWEVQGAGTAPPRNTGGRGHAHGGRARSPWPRAAGRPQGVWAVASAGPLPVTRRHGSGAEQWQQVGPGAERLGRGHPIP